MKPASFLTMIVLLLFMTSFQASDKKEKKAKQQLEMAQLIDKGRFCFIPSSANSSIGNINDIMPGYEMIFDSVRVISNMPYYGRSYEAFYHITNGIRFTMDSEHIKKSWSESKKKYTIKVNLKDGIVTYSIELVVGLDGFAALKIYFANNELTTYYGTIEKIPTN
jgi:hypothetical protein